MSQEETSSVTLLDETLTEDVEHGNCSLCYPNAKEGDVLTAFCGESMIFDSIMVDDPYDLRNPCSMCVFVWENHFH